MVLVRRETHVLRVMKFVLGERNVVEVGIQSSHGAGHGVVGTGVAFLMHGHGKDPEIGFISGENYFFDRCFFGRDDFNTAFLLFQLRDFQAHFQRRFDIAHVERVGDVLACHPGVVEHREFGLFPVERGHVLKQHHFRLVAHVEVLQISDGLVIVGVDEIFFADDGAFSFRPLLGDEARQIFSHENSPLKF